MAHLNKQPKYLNMKGLNLHVFRMWEETQTEIESSHKIAMNLSKWGSIPELSHCEVRCTVKHQSYIFSYAQCVFSCLQPFVSGQLQITLRCWLDILSPALISSYSVDIEMLKNSNNNAAPDTFILKRQCHSDGRI